MSRAYFSGLVSTFCLLPQCCHPLPLPPPPIFDVAVQIANIIGHRGNTGHARVIRVWINEVATTGARTFLRRSFLIELKVFSLPFFHSFGWFPFCFNWPYHFHSFIHSFNTNQFFCRNRFILFILLLSSLPPSFFLFFSSFFFSLFSFLSSLLGLPLSTNACFSHLPLSLSSPLLSSSLLLKKKR